jgi:hypothetical protein
MLADIWHAPHAQQAIGTATTGSSEAIQLGGLAMKRIWQAKRKAAGKSIFEPGPNIVMYATLSQLSFPVLTIRHLLRGANAQVALEKFARYFEVECRLVPTSVESNYCLDPKKAMEYVDENTIGVYVIMGSQYLLHPVPSAIIKRVIRYLHWSLRTSARDERPSRRVRENDRPLSKQDTCPIAHKTNVDGVRSQSTVSYQSDDNTVPRLKRNTVDGASGGFIAPFATVRDRAFILRCTPTSSTAEAQVGLPDPSCRLDQHFVRYAVFY